MPVRVLVTAGPVADCTKAGELISEIKEMFADGTVHKKAREITEDDFDELPEDVQIQMARVLLDPEDQHLIPNPRKLQ